MRLPKTIPALVAALTIASCAHNSPGRKTAEGPAAQKPGSPETKETKEAKAKRRNFFAKSFYDDRW